MNQFEQFLQNPVIRRRLDGAIQRFGYSTVMQMVSSMPQRTMTGIKSLAAEDGDPQTEQQIGRKKEQKKSKKGFKTLAQMGILLGLGGIAGRALGGLSLGGDKSDGVQQGEVMGGGQPPPPPAPALAGPQTKLLEHKPDQPLEPSPKGPMSGQRGESPPENIVSSALEGLNFNDLNSFQKEKIGRMVKHLERLQADGKGLNDKNVRGLISQIRKVGKSGVADQELSRLEKAYPKDSDERVEAQTKERIAPAQRETESISAGDLVETTDGKNGRVVKVDEKKGVATVKIDKKTHSKKLDSLTKKDWNELISAPIEKTVHNADLDVGLIKYRKGPWYAYQNIDDETYQNLNQGKGRAKTSGEFAGIKWWENKNPSKGAALHKFIRNNQDIPYSLIGDTIDIDDFFANFDVISPNLEWKIPKPKSKKNKRKKS